MMADTNAEDTNGLAKSEIKLPLHEDIMQLACRGEVGPIQNLLDEGKFDATYKDEEGITPLHWAAINNQQVVCKFLIERGADVNAKGGESIATPVMWALQRCHLYVVYLLLQHGADPLLTDEHGYNILHLATFDGNVFLLLLVLHQGIPIDGPDPSGHTCLMWAAYRGYPACVELLLQWGAGVNMKDEKGFTALHWALVKGNYSCISKLVEAGSDRFAKTHEGKTPEIVAKDMNTAGPWHRALRALGYNMDATPMQLPLPYTSFLKSRVFLKRFYFICPFVLLFVVFTILSKMVIYVALPLALFLAYTLQFFAMQMLVLAPSDMKQFDRTPYMAGVFAASFFWVGVRSATDVLKSTLGTHLFLSLLFLVCYPLCGYFYTMSMIEDPGFVPKLSSRTSQKAVIYELLSLWKLNEDNFCAYCMIRTPVRSKHCRRCSRCVAKHDHHCPWIYNCVGANNQRHFFLFILITWLGVMAWLRLVVYHLEDLPAPTQQSCNVLPDHICDYIFRDSFTSVVALWIAIQMIWVTMLMSTQLFLIARGQTTWESLRGHGPPASRASEVVTSALTAGSTSLESAGLTGEGHEMHAADHSRPRPRRRREGCFAQWKTLLGLDSFVATASGRAAKRRNPYSRGMIRNCQDFWCDPSPYFRVRENGNAMFDGTVVNYTMMYEPPPRVKIRRGDGEAGGMYQSVGGDDNV